MVRRSHTPPYFFFVFVFVFVFFFSKTDATRTLCDFCDAIHTKAFLNVSSGKMTLISRPDESIIMRHSTCRVAFSTVDPANPTTFCYVALVKDTELALCHVFRAKTAKQAYELTFTCAQAFDFNYRAFVAKSSAALDSSVLEPTLEPEAIRDHIATIVETMDSVAAADEEAEDMRANAGYMEISSMIFNAAVSRVSRCTSRILALFLFFLNFALCNPPPPLCADTSNTWDDVDAGDL